MPSHPFHVPWRMREFVTVAEAASIVGRSPSWIRDRAGEGRLTAVRLQRAGGLLITVESLRRLVAEAEPARLPAPRRPALALVSDNS